MNFTQIAVEIAAGIPISLATSLSGIAAGSILAAPLALGRLSRHRWPRAASWIHVQTIRSIPMIALLFLIYFGLSQFPAVRQSFLWPVLREPLWCAILALALKTSAYFCEVYRIGIMAVPPDEIEAARAFGYSGLRLYRHIIVPYGVRVVLPALSSEFVVMVKASSLASLVTLMDITGIAASIASQTYRPIAAFSVAAIYYLAFNALGIAGFRLLERRLAT
ncbi:MAG: ABC transporter permease [Dongiaceae bacterium]